MYEFMKKFLLKMVNLIVQKSSFTTQTATMNKLNQLDFTGTNIYCGLDVHLKNWRINIRDDDMELRDFSQNPDPAILSNFLKKNYPGATYKVGYEAGFCGFYIQRSLTSLGIQCVVKTPLKPAYPLQSYSPALLCSV